MEGLVFGWRTALLSLAAAQLLVLAIAIARSPINRSANRLLAALLIVLIGVLTPWMIGFAGFYDRWRWLTFAPFSITLAVGALVWLYVRTVAGGAPPRGAWRHLVPPAAQFAYFSACFLLPEPAKDDWAKTSSGFAAALGFAATFSFGAYGIMSLITLHRYRRRLADQRSDDAKYALEWLGHVILATLTLLPIWTVYVVWDAFSPLGYVNFMGLYVTIAAFALYIGVEGWRHAGLVFPILAPVQPVASPARDWAIQAEAWAERVCSEGWAMDPALSLPILATRLGTNAGYLSRALNDGLGVNFSTFINNLRAEFVGQMLEGGDKRDLLEIGFDAGFVSKASFNRAFKARYGQSPSAYRRKVSDHKNPRLTPKDEAQALVSSATKAA
jgi:AraC-like DNA-binding protein